VTLASKQQALSTPRPQRIADIRDEAHELHIRMVECDPRIRNHLQLAASALAMEARRSSDLRRARILLEACARIIAVARVHDRLQALDLGDHVEIARALPELCDELYACLEDADTAPLPAEDEAGRAVAVDWIASQLLEGALEEGAESNGVCVRLEHDSRGVRQLTVTDMGGKQANAGLRLLRAFTARFGDSLQSASMPPGASISVLFS
jgi:two-component sensor histidine kinase